MSVELIHAHADNDALRGAGFRMVREVMELLTVALQAQTKYPQVTTERIEASVDALAAFEKKLKKERP